MKSVTIRKLIIGVALTAVACAGDVGETVQSEEASPSSDPQGVAADESEETPAPEWAEGFAAVFIPYGEIRLALSEDRMDGVAEVAARLSAASTALAEDFSAERAGIEEADAEIVRPLLPELGAAATVLAESADLDTARAAFQPLSELILTYRDALVGPAPLVAYCPMVEASWLQTDEEIANPYYGSEMLRCGEIVRR